MHVASIEEHRDKITSPLQVIDIVVDIIALLLIGHAVCMQEYSENILSSR